MTTNNNDNNNNSHSSSSSSSSSSSRLDTTAAIARIEHEYERDVEHAERLFDAGSIDSAQFDALVHSARVRKITHLDTLLCTPRSIALLSKILLDTWRIT